MKAISRSLVSSCQRRLGWLVALAFVCLLYPEALEARTPPIPVIDLHVDLPYRSLFKGQSFSRGSGEFVANQLIKAGVRGVVLPLFVPEDASPRGRSRQQLEKSYAHVFRSILLTRPYSLPGCGVARASGHSRALSTWLAFEGASPLGANKEQIRRWVLRGVRSFGLVHSVDNSLSASSGKGPHLRRNAGGLSEEGRRFVRAVSEVGALVDVSHASDSATDEAIKISLDLNRVIIATHSNARALAPHARNLTDSQIRGIAASGGVIGVNFHRPFLRSGRGKGASLSDLVRQVRYIAALGGIGALALGSDFEGGISPVAEISGAKSYQRLASALKRDGMSVADIRKLFFENALRVLCPPT